MSPARHSCVPTIQTTGSSHGLPMRNPHVPIMHTMCETGANTSSPTRTRKGRELSQMLDPTSRKALSRTWRQQSILQLHRESRKFWSINCQGLYILHSDSRRRKVSTGMGNTSGARKTHHSCKHTLGSRKSPEKAPDKQGMVNDSPSFFLY